MTIKRPKTIVAQVADILRQRINIGDYPPGSRLPSETELAGELGVSRSTIRTVLAKFAAEGLILRKQGDGTYINERLAEVDANYGGMWDFSRLIEANGYQPSIKTLSIESRTPTEQEAAKLEIAPDEMVIAMSRLFCADDIAVIFVTNLFPKSLVNVERERIDGDLPIHEILRRYCAVQVAYVISDIEATLLDDGFAKLLNREAGQPIIKLIETFYTKEHQPFILGLGFYDFTLLNLRLVQAWG